MLTINNSLHYSAQIPRRDCHYDMATLDFRVYNDIPKNFCTIEPHYEGIIVTKINVDLQMVMENSIMQIIKKIEIMFYEDYYSLPAYINAGEKYLQDILQFRCEHNI